MSVKTGLICSLLVLGVACLLVSSRAVGPMDAEVNDVEGAQESQLSMMPVHRVVEQGREKVMTQRLVAVRAARSKFNEEGSSILAAIGILFLILGGALLIGYFCVIPALLRIAVCFCQLAGQ